MSAERLVFLPKRLEVGRIAEPRGGAVFHLDNQYLAAKDMRDGQTIDGVRIQNPFG